MTFFFFFNSEIWVRRTNKLSNQMQSLSALGWDLGWWPQLAPKWPPTKTKVQVILTQSVPPCSLCGPQQREGAWAVGARVGREGGRQLHVLTWGRCSICRGWSSCLVPGMSRDEDRSQRWVTWQFWRGGGTNTVRSSSSKCSTCRISS